MYVWRLTYDESGKAYTAQRLSGLDNVMRYAGCSVRTIGNAGIRVVTEVPKHAREAMMGARGLKAAGFWNTAPPCNGTTFWRDPATA